MIGKGPAKKGKGQDERKGEPSQSKSEKLTSQPSTRKNGGIVEAVKKSGGEPSSKAASRLTAVQKPVEKKGGVQKRSKHVSHLLNYFK